MSKNILRWVFAIAALGLSSFLVVHGQIGISTLSVDVNLPPGGSFTGAFEVINSSDQAREFTVELKDYDRNIEGGLVLLTPGTHPRSLAKFLTFAPAKFALPPKQKQLITFKIEIPSSEKGPHWAALTVTSPAPSSGAQPPPPAGQQPSIPVTIGTAEQFIVKIRHTDPTNAVNRGRITSVQALLPERDKPLRILVEYENTGTTFQVAKTQLRIVNSKGEVVVQKKAEDMAMLPGGKQRLEIPVTEKLPSGTYLALVIIDFGGDFLVAGQVRFQI
jgi:hypothetical protein